MLDHPLSFSRTTWTALRRSPGENRDVKSSTAPSKVALEYSYSGQNREPYKEKEGAAGVKEKDIELIDGSLLDSFFWGLLKVSEAKCYLLLLFLLLKIMMSQLQSQVEFEWKR